MRCRRMRDKAFWAMLRDDQFGKRNLDLAEHWWCSFTRGRGLIGGEIAAHHSHCLRSRAADDRPQRQALWTHGFSRLIQQREYEGEVKSPNERIAAETEFGQYQLCSARTIIGRKTASPRLAPTKNKVRFPRFPRASLYRRSEVLVL